MFKLSFSQAEHTELGRTNTNVAKGRLDSISPALSSAPPLCLALEGATDQLLLHHVLIGAVTLAANAA